MRDSHIVVGNVMVLLAKQLATWSLTGVLILFLPRYLGDEGLGQITFATSFTGMFGWLILLGVPTYLVKEVARDRSKISSYLFNSLIMRVILSVLVFFVIVVSINATGYSGQARTVVYIGALTTIALCLNNTTASVLQGMENMRWQSVAEISGKVVITAIGLLVLVNGHGVIA